MRAGEFDFYGETMMTLSGGRADHVAAVTSALAGRGIPYAVERGVVAGHQRVHIPAAAFDRIDDAFWEGVNGPTEPLPDPYSFRTMVRELRASARQGVGAVRRAAPRVSRRRGRR